MLNSPDRMGQEGICKQQKHARLLLQQEERSDKNVLPRPWACGAAFLTVPNEIPRPRTSNRNTRTQQQQYRRALQGFTPKLPDPYRVIFQDQWNADDVGKQMA